jgi:hypothetical protein
VFAFVDANPLTAGAVLVSPYFFSFGTTCTHIATVERRFDVLRHLTELERAAISDARRARSPEVVDRLRAEIRQRAGSVAPSSGSGPS